MTNQPEPDYAVIRSSPGLPMGILGEYDGRWYDIAQFALVLRLIALPTGRFEVNAIGRIAEVWELQSLPRRH